MDREELLISPGFERKMIHYRMILDMRRYMRDECRVKSGEKLLIECRMSRFWSVTVWIPLPDISDIGASGSGGKEVTEMVNIHHLPLFYESG